MNEPPLSPESDARLARFVEAQKWDFDAAISELQAGRKRSHWMWFVFPQLAGLGRSPDSVRYAIRSIDDARAYLAHPVLGPRLLRCTEIVIELVGKSALQIFGSPDHLKFGSCMTLFAQISPEHSPFSDALRKYFDAPCAQTLHLLGAMSRQPERPR